MIEVAVAILMVPFIWRLIIGPSRRRRVRISVPPGYQLIRVPVGYQLVPLTPTPEQVVRHGHLSVVKS